MAIIVLMIGGMFAHADYLDPWDKRYYKIFKEPRLQILSIGVLTIGAQFAKLAIQARRARR